MDPDLLVGVLKNLIESGVVSYSGLTETIEGYSATAYHAVMVANSVVVKPVASAVIAIICTLELA